MTTTDNPLDAVERPALRRAWIRRVVLLVIACLFVVAIARFIRRIDWVVVGDALSHLAWWQPVVLFVVLLLRQVANAAPLSLNVPGTSLYRATVNDMGAVTMAVVAPPPTDMALRVAMFNSWGVATPVALAGTVMNAITFYVIRFSAPLLGFIIVVASRRPLGWRWMDLISLGVAAALITGLLLVIHNDEWARTVGRSCGQVARSLRRPVDPENWADSCADFRASVADRFPYAFPRSILVTLLMVFLDISILALSLRFVGVSAAQVSAVDIAIAFLFAFPLTAFPMTGLGVVDAVVLASLVQSGGAEVQEPAVAAIIIWRVFTLIGPFLMGLLAVALWRRSTRKAGN